MKNRDHILVQKRASLFICLCAALIVLIATAVMYGWHTQNSFLVQFRNNYSPMKFNSAFTLMLLGFTVLAADRGHRRWAIAAALFSALLPGATLIEYAFGVDLGIDDIFSTSFIESKVKFVNRMAPNTAMAFFMTALAVFLYELHLNKKSYGELWLALFGSLIAAVGMVSLVGYMGGIESAHTWGAYAGMALYTALCLLMAGCSLVALALKRARPNPAWLPLPIAIGFLVVALSIWQAVRSYEDIRFEQSLQGEADFMAARSGDRMTSFYSAIDRIASRWVAANGTPREVWEVDAQNYIMAYPFLSNLEWVDGNSYLQWAIPADGTEQLHGIKLNTEGTRADTVQRAMATHAPQVTKAVDLAQGGKGFLYMSPLFLKNRFDGFIVAAFSLRVIYDKMLLRDKGGPFYLTVREGDDLVYSNTPDNYVQPERWSKSATFQNKDNIWTITVAPQPELLAKKNSPLPNLVLITGLLTSFFATVSVLFALRSRRVTAIVRENEERLGQVIATYDLLVATGYEIDTFMKILVERVEVLTEGTGAVIELIEGNEMVYKAASGSVESFVGFRLNRVGSMSGLCVEQGEIIVCDDTSKDPRVNYEACKKVGANSMVVVPLMQHEGVVGVLKVVSSRTHAFDAEHIRTLQLMAGLLGATLGQQIEMDRRMKLEEELRHMAQYDGLTGMPNRTLFRDRLTQALINNARSGKTLGVMFMDIDHFKTINDKYGHADGDELLKQFAARIASALRKGDTLARLGGDEFTVIAENLNNPADAEHVARKILDAMKAPFELPNVTLPIGVSIGVAVTDKKTVGFDYILGRADDALYEVKRAGRNNYKLVSV